MNGEKKPESSEESFMRKMRAEALLADAEREACDMADLIILKTDEVLENGIESPEKADELIALLKGLIETVTRYVRDPAAKKILVDKANELIADVTERRPDGKGKRA